MAFVRGPYYRKADGAWRLMVVQNDGTTRDMIYPERELAVKAKENLRRLVGGERRGVKVKIAHSKGTLDWGRKLLDRALKAVADDPDNDQLIKAARVITAGVMARAKLLQQQEAPTAGPSEADLDAEIAKIERELTLVKP